MVCKTHPKIINIPSFTHLIVTTQFSLRAKTYQLLAASPFQSPFLPFVSLFLPCSLTQIDWPCVAVKCGSYASCLFPFSIFHTSRATSERSPHRQACALASRRSCAWEVLATSYSTWGVRGVGVHQVLGVPVQAWGQAGIGALQKYKKGESSCNTPSSAIHSSFAFLSRISAALLSIGGRIAVNVTFLHFVGHIFWQKLQTLCEVGSADTKVNSSGSLVKLKWLTCKATGLGSKRSGLQPAVH